MKRRSAIQTIAAGAAALSCIPLSLFGEEQQLSAPAAPSSGQVRSIWLSQVGFRPQDRKVATVVVASADVTSPSFRVLRNGSQVLQGKCSDVRMDEHSGDATALADISSITAPGDYRIEADGVTSDTFPIAEAAYAEALRLAMRSFYGQRCGCKVDLGGGYKHPACHKDCAYGATSGRSGRLKNTGGWHDAGDYGRYVVNSGISTGTLLWAFELFPEAVRSLQLDLHDGNRSTPDFLTEVRWNLQWMLSLQDNDGGVWHKQTSEHFCAFIMPQDDKLVSEVIGTGNAPFKSTCATATLAAVSAIASRCFAPYDRKFSEQCLDSAKRGFAWANNNPSVLFRNPPGITTGDYGDTQHGADAQRLWAAAELLRTTSDQCYSRFLQSHMPETLTVATPSWGDVQAVALWAYWLHTETPSDLRQRIADATTRTADDLAHKSAENGYGNTLSTHDFVWGSNSVAGNHALLLLMANRMKPNAQYTNAALSNLHYLLGRNCFGVSWVTHVGARPFQHPHHRPSAADAISAPWPGLLSGGPNRGGGDAVANALPPGPPMRHWIDDQRAYSMNEVAINWNAPLVFLLAAANVAQNRIRTAPE